jgi:hypothetical protein
MIEAIIAPCSWIEAINYRGVDIDRRSVDGWNIKGIEGRGSALISIREVDNAEGLGNLIDSRVSRYGPLKARRETFCTEPLARTECDLSHPHRPYWNDRPKKERDTRKHRAHHDNKEEERSEEPATLPIPMEGGAGGAYIVLLIDHASVLP